MTIRLTAPAVVAAFAFFTVGFQTSATAGTATNLKCRGCVGARDIGGKAVTRRAIAPGSVDARRLARNATPAGYAQTTRDGETVSLSTIEKVVVSVTLDAPTRGYAVVTADGMIDFNGTANEAACAVAKTTTFDFTTSIVQSGDNAAENAYAAYSKTRVFPVAKGANSFNLLCLLDNAQSVDMVNPSISALFVPNKYQ